MKKQQKLILCRLRRKGQNFEIIIDPDKIEDAIAFREGKKDVPVHTLLYVDEIFKNSRTGDRASPEELKKAFGTDDIYKIAEIILKEGELQIPIELKKKEVEQKYKQLISLLTQYGKDPRTGLPIPPQRIEAVLEKVKIPIQENKPIELQLKKILEKLQPHLPISIEKRKYKIVIPAKYVSRLYPLLTDTLTILRDMWLKDGSWVIEAEVYVPQEQALFGLINKMTNNEARIELLK